MTCFETVCPSVPRGPWMEARRRTVGASESPILILGRRYGRSPLDLYMEKIGTAEDRDSEAMEWGREMEPVIAAKLFAERGLRPWAGGVEGVTCLLRSRSWPSLSATPDGFAALRRPWGRVKCAVELKTSGRPWDGLPSAVWIQVQHQLAVTGLRIGFVGALIGGFGGFAFESHEVVRDDPFIEGELVPACADFMRCVRDGVPPPAGAGDSAALARLYPVVVLDELAHVGAEWIEEDNDLLSAEADAKAAKGRVDAIRSRIKARIGGSAGIAIPNGVEYRRSKGKGFRLVRREKGTL